MVYKFTGNKRSKGREHRNIMKPILLDVLEELFPHETWVVHHKDGDKNNNDILNLQIMTIHDHGKLHSKGQSNPFYGKTHTDKTKTRISETSKGRHIGKYRGTYYTNKTRNPWTRVWKTVIRYNGHYTSLGIFEDPISGEIVYKLVQDEFKKLYI